MAHVMTDNWKSKTICKAFAPSYSQITTTSIPTQFFTGWLDSLPAAQTTT